MLGTSTEGIIAERTAPEVAHRPSRWWVPSMPWRSRLRPFQLKRSSRCGRRGPCPCWPKDGPTKENALAAEKELGQAMRTSDADGYCRLLDPDWAVVNGIGGLDDVWESETTSALRSRRAPLRERPMITGIFDRGPQYLFLNSELRPDSDDPARKSVSQYQNAHRSQPPSGKPRPSSPTACREARHSYIQSFLPA